MELKRPNKKLEKEIQLAVKGMLCPIHRKAAEISMPDENTEITVTACCPFFKKDIFVIGERIRKDFIYKAQKTAERLEKERLRDKYGDRYRD